MRQDKKTFSHHLSRADFTEIIRNVFKIHIFCISIKLLKLEALGVQGVLLDWFRSYLNKGQQKFLFNGKLYKSLKTERGVTRESVPRRLVLLSYNFYS